MRCNVKYLDVLISRTLPGNTNVGWKEYKRLTLPVAEISPEGQYGAGDWHVESATLKDVTYLFAPIEASTKTLN